LPLLAQIISGNSYQTFSCLITNSYDPIVNKIIVSNKLSIAFLLFIFFISLVIGFFVQRISAVFGWIFSLINNKIFFSSAIYGNADHLKLTVSLHSNKGAKLEWEWHLFRYWVDWGLTTNIILFATQVFILVNNKHFALYLMLIIAILGSVILSLQMSRLMYSVHKHIINILSPSPNNQKKEDG
ncbi:MAG: hypothetical protein NUV74_10460, partial [Candidatus Brocadiaceae bacterium]|nr:hypothetical protein [Candidatus Brocadiaceae bacterium]